MGFLDSLTWQLLGGSRSEIVVYNAVMDLMQSRPEWLSAVVQRFTDTGLGPLVSSWISTDANVPATSHQITMGLGADTITEIAQLAGMSEEEAAYHLSKLLPRIIHALTPNGTIPKGEVRANKLSFLSVLLS